MNDKARALFDIHLNTILQTASKRYDLDSVHLKRLGSYESIVYEYHDGDRNFMRSQTEHHGFSRG